MRDEGVEDCASTETANKAVTRAIPRDRALRTTGRLSRERTLHGAQFNVLILERDLVFGDTCRGGDAGHRERSLGAERLKVFRM